MNYTSRLIEARLKKRYKRFLADVKLANGNIITVHCANTGAMTGCQPENARVWLSESENKNRKYPHSWELVELENNALACINTGLTNKIVEEAINQHLISELQGYTHCRKEVVYGDEKSRIDFLLMRENEQCFLEVKHVTLKLDHQTGAFPDAVSKRGQKHLRELISQVDRGHRAVMLFVVMRTDIASLVPADNIDPDYGQLLRQAMNAGVEVLAYKANINLQSIKIEKQIPVLL
ncbi:MAG: DNA/RNA nuclease SfsA [Gammaproteobacteria bacterium]|nr:DNA/RNA nuclease SfsA [Gammaproteobacteria bacterium]MDH5735789.1 DNA/RNA nuclease SfsA [Gammaproteobacteria bacterium]